MQVDTSYDRRRQVVTPAFSPEKDDGDKNETGEAVLRRCSDPKQVDMPDGKTRSKGRRRVGEEVGD